jgi:hypothetical protein
VRWRQADTGCRHPAGATDGNGDLGHGYQNQTVRHRELPRQR